MILPHSKNIPIKKVNYTVNEKTFYNPYAAFLYAAHNCFHEHVHFSVFQNEFNHVDWKTYPESSYESLFLLRAIQLRNKYNKLGIMFSGGTDSTTVISSFLDNNIPIDFVVVLVSELNDNFKHLFQGRELINWVKNKWPLNSKNIEFIVVDYFESITKTELFYSEEYILSETDANPVQYFPTIINNGIKKAIDNKIAYDWKLITGHEPPNVNKNLSYFVDKTFIHILNKFWIEFFFLTPDLPEIVVKQAHDHAAYNKLYAVANEFPPLPTYNNSSLTDNQYSIKKSMMGCKCDEVYPGLSLIDKQVTYEYRNIALKTDFSNRKNIKDFESEIKHTLYGSHIHDTNKNKKELINWYNGIASLANDKTLMNYMVNHGYLNNHNQLPHNYNGILSKPNTLF